MQRPRGTGRRSGRRRPAHRVFEIPHSAAQRARHAPAPAACATAAGAHNVRVEVGHGGHRHPRRERDGIAWVETRPAHGRCATARPAILLATGGILGGGFNSDHTRPRLGDGLRPAADRAAACAASGSARSSEPRRAPGLQRRRDGQCRLPADRAGRRRSIPTCGPRAACWPTRTRWRNAAWKAWRWRAVGVGRSRPLCAPLPLLHEPWRANSPSEEAAMQAPSRGTRSIPLAGRVHQVQHLHQLLPGCGGHRPVSRPEVRRAAGAALPRGRPAPVARPFGGLLLRLPRLQRGLPDRRAHRGDQRARPRPDRRPTRASRCATGCWGATSCWAGWGAIAPALANFALHNPSAG